MCTALHGLICRVAGIEVGKNEHVGVAGHWAAGPFGPPYRLDCRGIVLQGPVDGQIGLALAHDLGGPRDLFDVASRSGTAGAEADHCHPGVDAEGPRRRRALDGDVRETFGVWLRVDGAVAVDKHLVGQAHEEHRGDQVAALLGAQDLQRGADRRGGGVHRAGNQAVHLSLPEHHGADHDGVGEALPRHLLGPALVLAELGQRADVTLGHGRGIDDGDALR